ncbi:tetratricopeptide repeat-containing hybrid sensor histidine kinase/response regulator [Nonlabens marinus]|uniref:histidine kinase n=1 Tax=Nonlabens marinus S1-08 TaxID=1454201 RepID=W8VP66_9FLAO|nr:ATP-binding protein [Nonlabens marinus]BAO54285.1 histidine kinase [Nonlabens marinus S1-08]
MAQQTDRPVSTESQQIAVDAILDRANLALQRNKFAEAQKIIVSAEEIATDSAIFARTQIVHTKYYSFIGQLDKAASNIKKLEQIIPKDSPSYLDLMLVKAAVNIKKKEFVEANEALKTINILLVNNPERSNVIQAEYLKADLLLHTSNFEEAINVYKRILPELKEEKLFYFEAKAAFNLSLSYYKQNAIEDANTSLDDAMAKATSFGFTGIELDCYDLKYNIEKTLGNYELALEYLVRYNRVRETAGLSLAGQMSNPEILGTIENLQSENNMLKAKTEEQTSELKGREMYSILLFVLLTLLSLLTMSLFKNNKLRARSNQALEGKNSALIDERDRAQDAAKIKADFLSTITHELRTPMYAVTGLTHLLLETEPRDDQKDHLETLQSSGEYLLSLIDNILDFNKLEANKVQLESIPFDLKKRVEDITVSLGNQAKDQLNNLNLEFDKSIPSRIKGDPVKISQILINLVGNAIKFTKNGNIWIRVNQVKQIDDKCLIHFEVEDNGKGISEEKQQDIFNNFTQEGSSTTREYGGTGLGLAIVKNLIELMGSKVELDSKIGRGSVFSFDLWFELPDSNKFYEENSTKGYDHFKEVEEYPEYKKPVRSNSNAEIKPEPKINEENKESTTTPVAPSTQDSSPENTEDKPRSNNDVIAIKQATPKDLIAKKILIVEDNKINQMITRKILEGKNFDCEIANNGIEALGKIKENQYDLVLMDIHMPGMDGKQCTREVRKFDRELPIIALTAVTLDESEKEFYEIGFDDIIPKPFKMNEFFEKIQKAFTNYQIY